jgi:uncharacterized protein RhaS with RHS repeats
VGSVSLTTSYAYDSGGRLDHMTYPSGQVVYYSYDNQGRTIDLTVGSQTLLSSVQYTPFGGATGWIWGNSSTYSRPTDTDGRVSAFSVGGGSRSVTYDDQRLRSPHGKVC